MNKKALSFVSIILYILFVFSAFSLCFYASAETEPTYQSGDIIEFGNYPQSKLDETEDAELIAELEKRAPVDNTKWISYGYYSGSGYYDDGQMSPKDYMRYKDIVYNGEKYRAVIFDTYRPYETGGESSEDAPSYQNANGYICKNVYWFKYESIKWRVLDPLTGLIMCNSAIDSQAYSNYISYGMSLNGSTGVFWKNDTGKYASDYTTSSLRTWLNSNFYNTAFSKAQKNNINLTELSETSEPDKVFLLSYDEIKTAAYGFNSDASANNVARQLGASDYAKCQGCFVNCGICSWWLGTHTGIMYERFIDDDGSCFTGVDENNIPQYHINFGESYHGVVPALRLSILKSDTEIELYHSGDKIIFGNYPQSRLNESEDADLISALNSLAPQDNSLWDSYGYYSGTGEDFDGKMEAKDYMRYKDVVYEGNKYRAVVFDTYRPASTDFESTETGFSYQNSNIGGDKNKYTINTVYWFRFEPIEWRVLDPLTGLIMCNSAIDSQAYNNYILWFDVNGDGDWDEDDLNYGDKAQSYYANDYENSSIRKWLNEDFYNTAFTYEQKSNIKSTEISEFSLTDKVFLLSFDDVNSSEYGFNTGNTAIDKISHFMKSSDYAKCQGCKILSSSSNQNSDYYGNCAWWLRSPNYDTEATRAYDEYGRYLSYDVNQTYLGVVPAISLFDIESDISISTISAPNMFAVTFDLNGHGAILETQMIDEGQKIICPTPNPAEKGFIFGGWFTESECVNEWDFNNALVNSITLYAKWIECTHESSTSQPTCTAGTDCSLCQAHLPSKGHTIGNPITENESTPSCINDGSYDKVVYCSVCGEELSRSTISVPRTGHKDENNDGVCDVCGNKDEEINDISDLEQAKNAVINTGSDIKVENRTTVTVIATSNLPDGYKLAVYEGKTQLSVGTNKEVNVKLGKITKGRTVTVKVIGKDGQTLDDANEKTITISTDTSFFARILAIIKDLFGLIKPVVIKP